MPASSGDKLCPICDSPLQPGSKKCSFCGTDLSIFDIDLGPPTKAAEPASPPPKASVEAKVDEILGRPPAREAPPAPPPTPARQASVEAPTVETPGPAPPEAKPAPEAAPVPEPEIKPVREEQAAVEYFECPQCGAIVEATASSCPKCGVLFAEEGTDTFQCPACNTLVSIDAKSCPGCGAVFVEADEAAAEHAQPAAPAPKRDIEPPIAEIKAPPAKPEKLAARAPEPEAVPAKRGFMGSLFRRRKEAEPKPEKPLVKEEPARAVPAPAPSRPVEQAVPEAKLPEAPLRPAPAPAQAPPAKDKGRELARMVAEMKPLLALAREKEVDIGESKTLIDEAAVAGRERQIEKAIELVQRSKTVLMSRIDAHLAQMISHLNEEIKVAREFGGDISRATTYIQEIARARTAGDAEAAYVYADKVAKELLPITGRYNEAKKKIASLKEFIADCEVFLVDTKDARRLMVDANRAFDSKDFDKVESLVRSANESLYKAIPPRMNEAIKKARDELVDAKVRNVNVTPMLTVLKSATSLMKSGDYAQALKELREYRDMMKKS